MWSNGPLTVLVTVAGQRKHFVVHAAGRGIDLVRLAQVAPAPGARGRPTHAARTGQSNQGCLTAHPSVIAVCGMR
ncbi:MAG: hypothetical protein HOY79_08990 [Streptomyces sp.]|nr:hypothetical protein [Streptomyces sp.]